MGWYGGFPPYVSVAEKRAKALRQAEKLKKKLGNLEPVAIAGRTLAKSWWGKSWNENLERYSDYANRLPRGRSYLSNGMVLDLRIDKEVIKGIVAGTASSPYQITIRIQAISGPAWKRLVEKALGKVETLQTLLEGKFPEDLKELFFAKSAGLFPAPNEIKLDCSCPDWATMCKHVAAVLYGVGARLDTSPELFFTLRGVNMDDLIGQVARKETEKLLSKQPGKSSRIIQPSDSRLSDISTLFGVSLAADAPPSVSAEPAKPSKRPRKVAAKPKSPKAKAKIKPKVPPKIKKKPTTKA
ncbi:MAG: SWIM zinc finger family protein [Pseudomonadota bacterium]